MNKYRVDAVLRWLFVRGLQWRCDAAWVSLSKWQSRPKFGMLHRLNVIQHGYPD